MRVIEIVAYKFDELSEKAKQKAINQERENVDTAFIYDDAHKTVEAFHEIFGTKEGRNSWLDVRASHLDDNLMNLKGLRLRTYILNNFGSQLQKGKYYSLWSKTEMSYKHYKDGYPVLKSKHSKVLFERECVLTGMCYDDSLLQPIYEFLDWKLRPDYNTYMDFETLVGDCFASLTKDVESEAEARSEEAALIETITSNGYEFTEDGEIYNEQ